MYSLSLLTCCLNKKLLNYILPIGFIIKSITLSRSSPSGIVCRLLCVECAPRSLECSTPQDAAAESSVSVKEPPCKDEWLLSRFWVTLGAAGTTRERCLCPSHWSQSKATIVPRLRRLSFRLRDLCRAQLGRFLRHVPRLFTFFYYLSFLALPCIWIERFTEHVYPGTSAIYFGASGQIKHIDAAATCVSNKTLEHINL